MDSIDVSIIIPAYNAAATIGRVLKALSSQDYSKRFEIIIVDDGSSDETADIIRSDANVQYVFQNNAGPAAARNRGARMAKGSYLAFTDSDCIPHSNWISKLMNGFTTDDIAVVAGSYGIANSEYPLAQGIHKEIIYRHTHLMPNFPKAFGSYNFCVRRTIFEQVGGFNPTYRRASGEDNDLSYKIIKAHGRIYFERMAIVDHYHPTVVSKYLKEQFRHGFWRVKMYKDHPEMAGGDGYTFWKDIVEVPAAGLCLLLLVLSAFDWNGFAEILFFALSAFLCFEIICGFFLMRNFFSGLFISFIFFFRAFARTLGFSTGIVSYFFRK